MAKITTAHCKNFLAEFFARNPQIINALFGTTDPDEIKRIHTWTWQANCWKREHRCKPENSEYRLGNLYTVYRDGVVVNRYAEPVTRDTISPNKIALERGFVCNPDELEDSVKYLVLETVDGELLLGDYIGD